MKVLLTMKSSNGKTGPIPVSTVEEASCPDACPLKESRVCYAKHGPISWHWSAVPTNPKATSWEEYCGKIADLPRGIVWRHAQAGDLYGENDILNREEVLRLASAARGTLSIVFTHYPDTSHNVSVLQEAKREGMMVNLSCDSFEEVDRKMAHGLPCTVALPVDYEGPMETPGGHKIVPCVHDTKGISCAECKLCARDRKVVIGFRATGAKKKQLVWAA